MSLDGIAVIGMSCRFPGAKNYREFWKNLIEAKSSISEIPSERWNWEEFYGDPSKESQKTNSKWGGFIEDIDKFDPLFFGISPKEAKYMDPQHRIFFESVWHAMEDAGYSKKRISGKKIGVYAGVSKNDYAELLRYNNEDISSFISTGTVHSILANRVSYFLNLKGKSEVVDTACSSFLVALNNAIRDIEFGDCEAAFVGGVNALITPTMYISHAKSGMLSSEGKCKTFDREADGYVRSEGVGCLFIKPLKRAIEDQDNIIGIIKGIAVNHNGNSNSLTSPSQNAQIKLIQTALQRARLKPSDISFIETHGTATPLGDPIEVNSLKKVFEADRDTDFSCGLGSVKTNIGHLESASGIAGVIKVLLSLKFKKIPKSLNFKNLNPYIDLNDSPFEIIKEIKDISNFKEAENRKTLIAGVSSFGMGGVNAHAIISEYSGENSIPKTNISQNTELIYVPISAKSKNQLNAYVKNIVAFLETEFRPLELADVAHTFQIGRDEFEHRIVLSARNIEDFISECDRFLKDGTSTSDLHDDLKSWLSGKEIDWNRIKNSQTGKIKGLPGYPFEQRSCWVGKKGFTKKNPFQIAQSNFKTVETKDGNLYSFNLSAAENYFVRDHKVQGESILPGVAYLELVRLSFYRKYGKEINRISNIYWLSPLKFSISNRQMDVQFFFEESNSPKFTITSQDSVLAEGVIELGENRTTKRKINISDIKSRCSTYKSKSQLYSQFYEYGLDYGDTFQVIEEGFFGSEECICQINRTGFSSESNSHLEPSILDGVFQSVVGLCIWGSMDFKAQLLPFYLGSLQSFSALTDICYAYVMRSKTKGKNGEPSFEMFLTDVNGEIIIEFTQFLKRPYLKEKHIDNRKSIPVASNVFSYTTSWIDKNQGIIGESPETILLIDTGTTLYTHLKELLPNTEIILALVDSILENSNDSYYYVDALNKESIEFFINDIVSKGFVNEVVVISENVSRNNEEDYLSKLYLVQSLISAKSRKEIKILNLYEHNENYLSAFHRMISGFARTLAYEYPRISLFNIGIAQDLCLETKLNYVHNEIIRYVNAPLKEILYTPTGRKERVVIPLNYEKNQKHDNNLFTQKGCYLITGGTGKIGMTFSKFLSSKYKATIILLGKTKKNHAIENKLYDIEKLGGDASYYSADLSDLDSVKLVLQNLSEKGVKINGIIHAAGIIDDSFIINKTADSFKKVLNPKVYGLINLDECTKKMNLDFFIVFSSIASLMPNQGQCDYSSANSFLDHYMEIRHALEKDGKRSGISISFNWPLWAEGGISVGEQERKHLWEEFGMKPISNETAIASFEKSLSDSDVLQKTQIIMIEGIQSKIDKHLRIQDFQNEYYTQGSFIDANKLDQIIKKYLNKGMSIDQDAKLVEQGLDSVNMVRLADDINEQLNVSVNPIIFFEHNTLRKLKKYLQNENSIITGEKEIIYSYTPEASLLDLQQSDSENLVFRKRFFNNEFYMRDHVVNGMYNVPGACYVEMAYQAASINKNLVARLSDIYWPEQLSSAMEPIDSKIKLFEKDGFYTYEISSGKNDETIHATGKIHFGVDISKSIETQEIDYHSIQKRLQIMRFPDEIYDQIIAEGLHVGPSFMPMQKIFIGENESLGFLHLNKNLDESWNEYFLHPSLLTGVFQTSIVGNKPMGIDGTHFIPIGIDEILIMAKLPKECIVHSIGKFSNKRTNQIKKFDINVCNKQGKIVLVLKGFAIRKVLNNIENLPSRKETTESLPVSESGIPLSEVERFLKGLLKDSTGLEVEEMDSSSPFQDFGINSRMIIELNQSLESIFSNLSKTLFFEYSSIAELAEYFKENHGQVLEKHIGFHDKLENTGNKDESIMKFHENLSPRKETTESLPVSESGIPLSEVERFLKGLLKDSTGLEVEEMDSSSPFQDFGINSRMIIELNQSLESIFSNLSKTLFFEYSSIAELAEYFKENHGQVLEKHIRYEVEKKVKNGDSMGKGNKKISLKESTDRISNKVREASIKDIAIVGIGGKYPKSQNLDEFWDFLKEGKDAIIEIPRNRFDYNSFKDSNGSNFLKSKWGSFLDDVDKFDPLFFNISPREAENMDPQERLFLEVVWETLEDAGVISEYTSKKPKNVGVFVGALWQSYVNIGVEKQTPVNPVAPGGLLYNIPNRVSYFFNWSGPSLAIDTACSSSLTAIHYGCQSIINEECESCIVGGVNLSLSSSKYLFLSQNNFLSTDGRCRSFGEGGDGYVPGEGIGAMLIKPLSEAIKNNDQIYGVIKASSVNHGGKTNGYTVPNPNQQGELIIDVLEKTKISPETVTYVEAHGTGTSLGDPIEITGLTKAFSKYTDKKQFCAIGSLKSNIGHLEAAAGVAGLTKILLQMKNKILVPSIHSQNLNPNINFEDTPFIVQQKVAPWETIKDSEHKNKEIPRRAMLSSFGAGGSNAHIIVEEYVPNKNIR